MIYKFLKFSFPAFILLSIFSKPTLSFAEYIEPSLTELKTEKYSPDLVPSDRGKYEYQVAWQGIPVAEASIDIQNVLLGEAQLLDVTAWAKTVGPASIFYRLDHTSESILSASNLQPKVFRSFETLNSEDRGRFVSFGEEGQIYSKRWKEGKDPEVQEFFTGNATFDPISAAILARSLPIERGKKFVFDVFNGKHRYEISFHVGEKETLKNNGQVREAFRVTPFVKKLTDTEGEKKLEHATLWISADDKREILKIESKVWIGSITATLTNFTPNNQVARISQSRLALNY